MIHIGFSLDFEIRILDFLKGLVFFGFGFRILDFEFGIFRFLILIFLCSGMVGVGRGASK